jgi:hypothetical protein
MPVYNIQDIPTEADADRVHRIFTADRCTVDKERQENGKWKITANCPEETQEDS